MAEDTPDLDKAREAARRLRHSNLVIASLMSTDCRIENYDNDIARLILEQRAEEAELAAEFIRESGFPGSLPLNDRAFDLRRQAGGEK